jgi:AcrR family transcriptional regulator
MCPLVNPGRFALVPTGIAIRDPREQLFDAAERVLLRDGPMALTSRAVTAEAGVAKGVLHRHFTDFDEFLAEFVLDRVGRMDQLTAGLRDAAGTGTVTGNLTGALRSLFGSVAVAVVPLVISRPQLRVRLRRSWPAGVPVLTQAAEIIAGYLAAERDLGRIDDGTDVDTLAFMIIGTVHLEAVGKDGEPPDAADIARILAVMTGDEGDRIRHRIGGRLRAESVEP